MSTSFPPIARPRPAPPAPSRRLHRPSPAPRLATPPRPLGRTRPPGRPAWKAALDFPLALLIGVATLPLLALALVATKLHSRGPAIYRQTRVGQGGRSFTIYKVRTMFLDCESLTGPRWSMPGDPRITPLGKILRKLHVDELPQLWNVLKGDMALVGPRPERPEIVAQLKRSIPSYDARHTARPGVTGYAQIHLPPDTTIQSVRNKVAYDRFYIRRQSLAFDAYVYACTLLKVVGLKGLYYRAPRKPTEE